jgi:hypothetical protein
MSTTTYTSRVKYKDHIHTAMTAKVNRKLIAEIDHDTSFLGRPAYATIYENGQEIKHFSGPNALDEAKEFLDAIDIRKQELENASEEEMLEILKRYHF